MYVDFLDLSSIIDKVYQLLAHGQWLSPGTRASSTTKTGRHDIAETLLKVALNTINQIKSITDKTFTGLYCMSNLVGVLYETAYYIELLDSLPVFGGVGVDHLLDSLPVFGGVGVDHLLDSLPVFGGVGVDHF